MRRWIMATAAALALALTGCSSPAGPADSGPSPDPAVLATKAPYEPKAGTCQRMPFLEEDENRAGAVVPCAGDHYGETVHVGQFTGEAAALPAPPRLLQIEPPIVAAQRAAYEECDRKATAYLGHAWYHVRLSLRIALPTRAAWAAGSRWYRCEIVELTTEQNAVAPRTAGLKDEWPPATCLNYPPKDLYTARLIPCTTKHNIEAVGAFLAGAATDPPLDEESKGWDGLYGRCRKMAAGFIGMSEKALALQYAILPAMSREGMTWDSGRRVVGCFVFLGKTLTFSVKGTKGKGVPRHS